MVTTAELGWIGEELAVRHLRRSGLVVVARNWRCARADVRGELDIVAREHDVVVFCEVKARRGDGAGGPLAAVTPAKQRQVRRLAAAYLAGGGLRGRSVRFDAVAVTWPEAGGEPRIDHLRGIC
jgi:putative endonuclease